jgi:hypothetical protein
MVRLDTDFTGVDCGEELTGDESGEDDRAAQEGCVISMEANLGRPVAI